MPRTQTKSDLSRVPEPPYGLPELPEGLPDLPYGLPELREGLPELPEERVKAWLPCRAAAGRWPGEVCWCVCSPQAAPDWPAPAPLCGSSMHPSPRTVIVSHRPPGPPALPVRHSRSPPSQPTALPVRSSAPLVTTTRSQSHTREAPGRGAGSPASARRCESPPGRGCESPPPGHGCESPPPGHGCESPPQGHGCESPPPGHRRESPPPAARNRESPSLRTGAQQPPDTLRPFAADMAPFPAAQ